MVRMRSLLPLASLLAACANDAPPTANDAAAVVSLAVRTEAGAFASDWPGPVCVQREIDGRAFDERRREIANWASPAYAGSTPKAEVDRRLAAFSAQQYHWRPFDAPGGWGSKITLDPGLAHRLDAAAGEIVRKAPEPALVKSIDPQSLPPRVRFCTPEIRQPNLSVSAPAFHGNVAFVETGFVCGGLCGNGLLFALRRTNRGWEVAGVADTWVS
jgi:hypothetical protein